MIPLFLLFLRRLLLAKRTLFFGAIAFMPCLLAVVFRAHRPHNYDALRVLREILSPLTLSFPAVLLPLFFGATAFGEEIEGKTIPYLLTRPRRRGVVLLTKTLAVSVACALLVVPGYLLAAAILRGADPFAEQQAFAVAVPVAGVLALACLVYGAIFVLFGLALPHPVLWGLVFAAAWEGFVGHLPGQLNTFTAMRYLLGPVAEACDLHGEVLGIKFETAPPGVASCLAVLALILAAVSLAADRVLRRRDFAV